MNDLLEFHVLILICNYFGIAIKTLIILQGLQEKRYLNFIQDIYSCLMSLLTFLKMNKMIYVTFLCIIYSVVL